MLASIAPFVVPPPSPFPTFVAPMSCYRVPNSRRFSVTLVKCSPCTPRRSDPARPTSELLGCPPVEFVEVDSEECLVAVRVEIHGRRYRFGLRVYKFRRRKPADGSRPAACESPQGPRVFCRRRARNLVLVMADVIVKGVPNEGRCSRTRKWSGTWQAPYWIG